jgi:hypothetical protein
VTVPAPEPTSFFLVSHPDDGQRAQFIDANSKVVRSCGNAAIFTLYPDGTLEALANNGETLGDGGLISTTPSTPNQPFLTLSTTNSINTYFDVSSGSLTWTNGDFANAGLASFYQDDDGYVWASFDGNPPSDGGVPTALVPSRRKQHMVFSWCFPTRANRLNSNMPKVRI